MLRTEKHGKEKTRALMRKFFKRAGRQQEVEHGHWEPTLVMVTHFAYDYENGRHRRYCRNGQSPTVVRVVWIDPYEQFQDPETQKTLWSFHLQRDLLGNPKYVVEFQKQFCRFMGRFEVVNNKAYLKPTQLYCYTGKWLLQLRREDQDLQTELGF